MAARGGGKKGQLTPLTFSELIIIIIIDDFNFLKKTLKCHSNSK